MSKIPNSRVYVLPASGLVSEILDRAAVFAETGGNEAFTAVYQAHTKDKNLGFNRDTVTDLVVAIYLDHIEGSALWYRVTHGTSGAINDRHYEAQLWKMLGLKPGDLDNRLMTRFYFDVISDAYENVVGWFHDVVEVHETWDVWYVRRLGNDVLLERGPDYRILDWERRMEAGALWLKEQKEGEATQPPPEGWYPDDACKYYAETLRTQQGEPSGLGKSFADRLDKAQAEKRERLSLRRVRQPAGLKELFHSVNGRAR